MRFLLVFFSFLALSGAFNLSNTPLTFNENEEELSLISDEIAQSLAKEYDTFLMTGVESTVLLEIFNQLAAIYSQNDIFETNSITNLSSADQFVMCTTCRAAVSVGGKMYRDPNGELNGPSSKERTKKIALKICNLLVQETLEVCSGLFELNWPAFEYIVHNSIAESRSLCGVLPIKFCKVKQNEFNFQIKIDTSRPKVVGSKSDIPAKSNEDLKILQITDIHYDPEYEPGSLADCKEPLCCQRNSKNSSIELYKQAGYWGDYRKCDSPLHTIENAFDHIKETHIKLDYIYHTGDIVPHIEWTTTKDGNIKMLTKINNLIAEKFGSIPVFPTVGNHESHPFNIFSPSNAPEEINSKWLYDHLWSLWSRWLPAEAKDTVLKGGYYTVSPKTGFRIISLNNNYGSLTNWWIYYNGGIAIEQLQWLHDTLLAAEKAGEYVHLLAHIPSGFSHFWTVWAREYNRIIERFNGIIGGIFNGHSHMDELNVHYTSDGYAVGVSWNGGSLTTYSYKNPNYIIYEVEPKSLQVVDYETWIFGLDEANANGPNVKPKWFKEYSFSEFTNDLSPAGLNALLDKFTENPYLLRKYWQYRSTSARPILSSGCNNKCLSKVLCRMAVTNHDQKKRCKELQKKFEANAPRDTTVVSSTDEPTSTSSTPTETPSTDSASTITILKLSTTICFLTIAKFIY